MNNKRAPKCTKAEMYKRMTACYQMITQGANNADIIAYGRSNWGVGTKAIQKLLTKTRKWIRGRLILDMEKYRDEANVRFDKLYARMFNEGDYRGASIVQSMKNKINGLESIPLDKRETILNINFNMQGDKESFLKTEGVVYFNKPNIKEIESPKNVKN